MDIVTHHKKDLVVNHRLIAKMTENNSKSISDLITRYKSDFEEFGTLAILNRKTKGRPQSDFLLNENQATLLMTYLKNTPIVRQFKKELVKQFYMMKQYIQDKAKSRDEARLEYKPMQHAIKHAHDPAMPYHYANEADLINSIVVGMTAKKYKELNKVISVRDNLQPFQLEAIAQLERMNTSLIEIEQDYNKRKQILHDYYCYKLLPRLSK